MTTQPSSRGMIGAGATHMEKYQPLKLYMEHADRTHAVSLTFAQIESILGDALPPSAKRHPAFWANNPKRHVHAAAWLDTGWKVQSVDFIRRVVVFVPAG